MDSGLESEGPSLPSSCAETEYCMILNKWSVTDAILSQMKLNQRAIPYPHSPFLVGVQAKK